MKKPPTRRGDLRYWIVILGLLVMHPRPEFFLAGSILIVVGAAIHLWAKGCLRVESLTTWGPYVFVRHPFYLANALIDGGILMLAANPWLAAAAIPLWAFIYAKTIWREDAELVRRFGLEYGAYRRAVPALFPIRGRAGRSASGAGFAWSNPNVDGGREIPRLLRILAYPSLFITVWAFPRIDAVNAFVLGFFHATAFAMLARGWWRKKYGTRPGRPSPEIVKAPLAEPSHHRGG